MFQPIPKLENIIVLKKQDYAKAHLPILIKGYDYMLAPIRLQNIL